MHLYIYIYIVNIHTLLIYVKIQFNWSTIPKPHNPATHLQVLAKLSRVQAAYASLEDRLRLQEEVRASKTSGNLMGKPSRSLKKGRNHVRYSYVLSRCWFVSMGKSINGKKRWGIDWLLKWWGAVRSHVSDREWGETNQTKVINTGNVGRIHKQ